MQKSYIVKNILSIASIALQTLRSRTRASAELWNVRPNRLLPVHQWWKVGFAFVYCRSFFNRQLSTTWHGAVQHYPTEQYTEQHSAARKMYNHINLQTHAGSGLGNPVTLTFW